MINIKNIIFDLGSVILKGKPNSVLDDIDIDEDIYNELKRFFDGWEELDSGIGTLEDKYNECNFSKDLDIYKDYLVHYYNYRNINMELIDMIKKLKNNNYNVYIFSDNNNDFFEYFKKNKLFDIVDGYLFSCEYGILKRDRKLFEIFIDKFKLIPSECYFIDDKEVNIKLGNEFGFKGFIFKDNIDELYLDMKKNGIRVE